MADQITAFLDSYRDAFNALDAAAIGRHFALPAMLMDGAPVVWTTADQITANMQALTGLYRDKGFSAATYVIDALLPQGADDAVVNLLWTVERRQGPQWRFRTGYNLRRFGDGWKIVLCTAYEERAARISVS